MISREGIWKGKGHENEMGAHLSSCEDWVEGGRALHF